MWRLRKAGRQPQRAIALSGWGREKDVAKSHTGRAHFQVHCRSHVTAGICETLARSCWFVQPHRACSRGGMRGSQGRSAFRRLAPEKGRYSLHQASMPATILIWPSRHSNARCRNATTSTGLTSASRSDGGCRNRTGSASRKPSSSSHDSLNSHDRRAKPTSVRRSLRQRLTDDRRR